MARRIMLPRYAFSVFFSVVIHVTALPWLLPSLALMSGMVVPQPSREPVEVVVADHMADIDMSAGEPGAQDTLVQTEETDNAEIPDDTHLFAHKNQRAKQNEQARYGQEFQRKGDNAEVFDPKAFGVHGLPPESLSMADLNLDGKQGRHWSADQKFLARVFEGAVSSDSASNDYLPDIPMGMRTLLNTKEYKFHLYLERIRRDVTQPWRDEVERRMAALFLTGSPIAQRSDLISKLLVTLDDKGALTSVLVTKSSGSRTIDLAGETVFRKAQVFPNPPQGIVGDDGVIRLRWTFVLKVVPNVADVPTTSESDKF